uniref:Uncharacterized protein n=1 Tax=Scophthalmus maximus TaxID=52904 RepID=A0A8D3C1P6_SCOMX
LGLPGPRLGHVITPLWLVEVQLLLGIGQHSQVCHRPLLAKTGRHRDPALRATHPVNLQLAPLRALGHSRLCPLRGHTNSFAICLAVRLCAIRPFHFQISFSASHTISEHAPCMRPYRKTMSREKSGFLIQTLFPVQKRKGQEQKNTMFP